MFYSKRNSKNFIIEIFITILLLYAYASEIIYFFIFFDYKSFLLFQIIQQEKKIKIVKKNCDYNFFWSVEIKN